MDDETRFWIAQQVADSKNTSDIQPLFKEGKERAGKKPNVLISDEHQISHCLQEGIFHSRIKD
jgi:hypothetical protein